MLTKIAAAWLIVLTLSPVTAPFSTCDLVTVFGSAADHGTPFAPAPSKAQLTNTTISLVPSARTGERVRLLRSLASTPDDRMFIAAASQSRSIAATALGSSHPSPPLILRV
jgi:hypothetical protein